MNARAKQYAANQISLESVAVPSCHHSGRLIMRKPTIKDVDALFAIFGDPLTNVFNPAGPYRQRAQAERRIERWLTHWEQYGFGDWAVCPIVSPREIIGFGGISYAMFGKRERINLGYRFATRAWGQGIATEFANASVDVAFRVLRLPEILATVRENHGASRRVLEKAGLRQIDVVPDPRGKTASIIYEIKRPNLEIQV